VYDADMSRVNLILLIVAAGLLAGCVERRIYLRSMPAGADVYVDGEYIGVTREDDHPEGPLYVNFIFYGTREFTFRKPGYTTLTEDVFLRRPWYQYPPVDFFAEVLAPWRIMDEHGVDVELSPAEAADVEDLYRNALTYRYRSRPQDRYEFAVLRGPSIIEPRR
jgi:hypothetical protein